jgi:cleavage and polyadenylation specificity factor subunit 2
VYGSRWSDEGQATEPQCTLVEYANARLLFNIGWWGYSCQDFPDLPGHDALIITESTVQCAGGLPLYQKQYAETPIFATFPTVKMGQMTMYDQHSAVCVDGKRPSFTLEEVDQAFGRVTCIKYSQSFRIRDLFVTAYRSGHVVGGTFFVLTGVNDDTSIVLTSSYNIAREMHLDPSTLLEHASNADVLVVSLRSVSVGCVLARLDPLSRLVAHRPFLRRLTRVVRPFGLCVVFPTESVLLSPLF